MTTSGLGYEAGTTALWRFTNVLLLLLLLLL